MLNHLISIANFILISKYVSNVNEFVKGENFLLVNKIY